MRKKRGKHSKRVDRKIVYKKKNFSTVLEVINPFRQRQFRVMIN